MYFLTTIYIINTNACRRRAYELQRQLRTVTTHKSTTTTNAATTSWSKHCKQFRLYIAMIIYGIYTYICVHIYIYVYIYMHICVCIFVCMYFYMFVDIFVAANTQMLTQVILATCFMGGGDLQQQQEKQHESLGYQR